MLALVLSLFFCFSTQENDHRYDGYRRRVQELTLSHEDIIPINTPYFVFLMGRVWFLGVRDECGCTITIGEEGEEFEIREHVIREDIINGLFEWETWDNAHDEEIYNPVSSYFVLYNEQRTPIIEFDYRTRVYNYDRKFARSPMPDKVGHYLGFLFMMYAELTMPRPTEPTPKIKVWDM